MEPSTSMQHALLLARLGTTLAIIFAIVAALSVTSATAPTIINAYLVPQESFCVQTQPVQIIASLASSHPTDRANYAIPAAKLAHCTMFVLVALEGS